MKECKHIDCSRNSYAKGYCRMHHYRWKKHGSPDIARVIRVCSIDGCINKHFARGFCSFHYHRWEQYGDALSEPARPRKSRKRLLREWCITSQGIKKVIG